MLISSITYRDLFIYTFGRCVHCIGMQHVSITRRLQWNIYTFLRDYFFTWSLITEPWHGQLAAIFTCLENLRWVYQYFVKLYVNMKICTHLDIVNWYFVASALIICAAIKGKLSENCVTCCCSFQTAPPATKVTKLLHVPTEVYSWHDMQKWLSSADRRLATFDRAFDITRDATGMYTGG